MGPDSEIKDKIDTDGIEFNFRPMTDGLGFHQDALLSRPSPSMSPSSYGQIKSAPPREELMARGLEYAPVGNKTQAPNRGVPFTGQNSVTERATPRRSPQAEMKAQLPQWEKKAAARPQVLEEARLEEKLLAMVIDFLAILLIEALWLALLYGSLRLFKVTGPANGFSPLLFVENGNWPLTIFLILPLSLLYFSLLDSFQGTSPGKVLAHIKLVRNDGAVVRFKDAFIRSLVVMTCLPLVGIPLLKDVQGRLSQTRIIKISKGPGTGNTGTGPGQ